MIFDDLQKASRMASRAAAIKDGVIKKSIAATARDSIFQFPCLAANTIPVNMATATVRLLDRNYASFVQIVLSQIANVDISVDRTPSQFLQRVHQNMKLESVSDEEERLITERFYNGELVIATNEKRGIALLINEASGSNTENLYVMNLESCREWMSDFDSIPFMEADGDLSNEDLLNAMISNSSRKSSRADIELAQKISNGSKAPMLMDRDVKKINDLQPYALQVRLNVVNDNNEFVEYWDIVVGVKTILHTIKSDEIIDNIVRGIQNKNLIFNFIRWTTGEISLFKDLIFHIDDIVSDVASRSNGNSPWFPTLKRLKEKKINFKNFRVNQLVPNSTLVISSYEAEILETKYGILIKDTNIAKRLVNNLFLMAFVILDDGSQTMDILYDRANSFETYALETIEREVSLNSNRLANEIGRMISSQR